VTIEAQLRLAEPLAALSLVTDLGMGYPPESAIRATLLATLLAERLGVDEDERRNVYYASILRYVGCMSTAHEAAHSLGGDDIAVMNRMTLVDTERPGEVMPALLGMAGRDRPPLGRTRAVVDVMVHGKATGAMIMRTHCEVAARLADRCGLDTAVSSALYQIAERWDGKGLPGRLKGDQIAVATRFATFAHIVVAADHDDGRDGLTGVVRRLSGRSIDPDIAETFLADVAGIMETTSGADCWDRLLAAEPGSPVVVPSRRLDEVAEAFGDAVDLKTPWLHGHSRGVAELAAGAALACRCDDRTVRNLRLAGHLHDLGRAGVPTGIWDRPGALSVGDWEQVRLHPYHTERILSRSPALAPIARLAGSHHERLDGSGYHRSSEAATLDLPARILAAADAYQALVEPRPHRAAAAPADAAVQLAGDRSLDREAVAAVCEAAGQPRPAAGRTAHPAGLTDREVDVLRLVAQGLTKKDMAGQLHVSTSTVHTHVVHIYEKIGLSTRAGAALFAMEHDLLRPEYRSFGR
jgi:HD-GYP domain-containing protein (c-di-GMP phosphodiesterase class II)